MFILSLGGCGQQCSYEIVKSSILRDKESGIRLDKKNCGATTGFVYELKSIEAHGGDGDLVLRFDSGYRNDWPDDDRKILDLKWLSGSQLEVDFHVPVRVFHERREFKGVPILYRYQAGTSRI
jgi:hypothetical protein